MGDKTSYSEIAMKITIAAMQPGAQSNVAGNIHRAEEVASFYETIFKKIIEMDNQTATLRSH